MPSSFGSFRSVLVAFLFLAAPLRAGFSGTDVFLAAVARAAGRDGSAFYSTVYITNAGASPASVRMSFYENNKSNTSPVTFSEVLAAGETKRHDNAVQTLFGLTETSGALRITSDVDVLVSSRTYNLPSSGDLDDSDGLFFSAIPAGFAIGAGETAQLQGVSQNANEDFRYNFGYVETAGQGARLRFTARSGSGSTIGSMEVDALPFERRQFSASDIASTISTSNARIEASVLSGAGKILVYGTQIANVSNDSAGFEMSFKNSVLAGGGGGVTSLNGLAGDVTLAAGSGITISPFGSTLTLSSTGGGGLALPFSGSAGTGDYVFSVKNTAGGPGLGGEAVAGDGILGVSMFGNGVFGLTNGVGDRAGVAGLSTATATSSYGVRGVSGGGGGAPGPDASNSAGVFGDALSKSSAVSGVQGRTVSASSGASGVAGFATQASASGGAFSNPAAAASAFLATQIGTTPYGLYTTNAIFGGSLAISGAKSFVAPHPEDASKEINYVAMEGPSSDVFFRGTARLTSGMARIVVPDHFRLTAREGSYMTTVTPLGSHAVALSVESEGPEGIVVRGPQDVAFHYVVFAERDLERDHAPVQENQHFRPEALEKSGALPEMSERLRAVLVKNGTLNPDGTFNRAKADSLGWRLAEGSEERR